MASTKPDKICCLSDILVIFDIFIVIHRCIFFTKAGRRIFRNKPDFFYF